jgi:hypothetical protein
MRHEMLLTDGPIPESSLTEIVDDVFPPCSACAVKRGTGHEASSAAMASASSSSSLAPIRQ